MGFQAGAGARAAMKNKRERLKKRGKKSKSEGESASSRENVLDDSADEGRKGFLSKGKYILTHLHLEWESAVI